MREPMILTPKQYYENAAVQQRLAEYCGGQTVDPESFATEYLSGVSESLKHDRFAEDYFYSTPRSSFYWLLGEGVDLFRAVWDRTATLGVLDTEYFNLIYPAEAYFNPARTFETMEPIYRRILTVFGKFGIDPLPLMTGQGYHFTFKVAFAAPEHLKLVALGTLGKTLAAKYLAPGGRRTRPVPLEAGLAFDGMGRIMEYFCHCVLRDLGARYAGIPVVCTDVSVGRAREAIALDLSMYADPLHTRDIRCAFSTYQKHKVLQEKFGSRVAQEIPVMVTLPRIKDMPLAAYLKMRTDFERSQAYAAEVHSCIPDNSAGAGRLIKSYRASRLYKFHAYCDAEEHDPPEVWPRTYDRFDPGQLPPCVAYCLRYPNDNLLKPTNIQTLTRVLVKMGWHPSHIAGLVRSKLERDYGWSVPWNKYDAATRAGYYVRLFAGLLATGLDREIDLNCISHREKGYCLQTNCCRNLADYRVDPKKEFGSTVFPGLKF
jgi:hypothetical protein